MRAFAPSADAGNTSGFDAMSTTTTGVPVGEIGDVTDHRDHEIGGRGERHGLGDLAGVGRHRFRDRRTRLPIRSKRAFGVRRGAHDLRPAGEPDAPASRHEALEPVEHRLDGLSRVPVRHPIDLPG